MARIGLLLIVLAGLLAAAAPASAGASGPLCPRSFAAVALRPEPTCFPDVISGSLSGSTTSFTWSGNLRATHVKDTIHGYAGQADVSWQLVETPPPTCVPNKTSGTATVPAGVSVELADLLDQDRVSYTAHVNGIDTGVMWICTDQDGFTEERSLADNAVLPLETGSQTSTSLRKYGGTTPPRSNDAQSFSWTLVGDGFVVPTLIISDNGQRYIEQEEAFRGRAYNDSAGNCTIGFGQLLLPKRPCTAADKKLRVTRDEAERRLREDLSGFEVGVRTLQRTLGKNLTQCQFDALVSFAYNVSPASFQSLAKTITAKGLGVVPAELQRFVKAKDQGTKKYTVKPELVARRKNEAGLFKIAACPCGGVKPSPRRPYYPF